MRCEEVQELITASIDDALTPQERAFLDTHLTDCSDCRAQRERESALKRALQQAGAAIRAPENLRAKIIDSLEVGSEGKRTFKPLRTSAWLRRAPSRPVWAVAATLVLLIATLVYRLQPAQDIASLALATHERVLTGKEKLERVADPKELREQLSLAVNQRFRPVALDLSSAKVRPVAGLVKRIGERQVLVTVYEGDGPAITCYTFLGTEADAPKGAELFRDGQMGVNFYIFSDQHVNAVLHKEGDVICILVSQLPPAEIINVLRGMPHHA
jgi:anti-sigma factor (TIGR02949 family)